MTKHILTTVTLFTLIFFGVQAQNLSVEATDTVVIDTVYKGDADIYQAITHLVNSSSSDITVNWELMNPATVLVAGWTNGFCNNEVCVDLEFATASTFTAPANDDVDIKAQIGPNEIDGETVWTINLSDSANAGDAHTVYYSLKAFRDVTVIGSTGLVEIAIYPNPATETLYFSKFDGMENIQTVEIYNVIGSLSKKVTFNQAISIADLEDGFYLIKMYDSASNNVFTQSFIKK